MVVLSMTNKNKHPMRCETCNRTGCPFGIDAIYCTRIIPNIISRVGCASHSSATRSSTKFIHYEHARAATTSEQPLTNEEIQYLRHMIRASKERARDQDAAEQIETDLYDLQEGF